MHAHPRKARRVIPGLAVAVGLLAASCGGSDDSVTQPGTTLGAGQALIVEDAGPAETGGSLRYCIGGETATGWNPTTSQWVSSSYVVANAFFEPLVVVAKDGTLQPYLLESFESPPESEFMTWVLKVRPGITFHDGEKLDGEAVAKNLEVRTVQGLVATAMEPVDSVEATGDLEVTVNMKTPWSTFPATLAAQVGYMQSPAQIPDDPTQAYEPDVQRNPVGTGPFKFQEWIEDSEMRTTRNDNYWRTAEDGTQYPYLEALSFPVLVDPQSRAQSLETGGCDVIETVDTTQILRFRERAENGEYQFYTDEGQEPGKIFITLNTAIPPFNRELAREIMAYGIDTEQVSLDGFQGVFPPANGPLSKASELYVETDYPKYDIAKAEALHQEYIAEYGEPLTFSAIVPPITEYINVAESIRLMGEPYGLQVEIRQLDQPSIVNALVTGDYTSSGTASQGRILFTSPLPDADYVFIASEPKAVGEVSLNFARFDNPVLRQCLDDFRKIPLGDIEAQKPAAKCVQDELAKSLQYIWLVEIRNAVIYQNSVHGFTEQTAPDGEPLPTSPNPFYYNIWVKR